MSSMLIEDVCLDCDKDNGINSGKHCKYCNEPLCKNKWNVNFGYDNNFAISTTTLFKYFGEFLDKEYKYNIGGKPGFMYKFSFKKMVIDFDKEKLMFYVNNLGKPLIIKFNSILKYKLSVSRLKITSSLTIILKNMNVVGIGYNSYNSKIFNILDKLFL
jgi:hypothetical protein